MQVSAILSTFGIEWDFHDCYRSEFHRSSDIMGPFDAKAVLGRSGLGAKVSLTNRYGLIPKLQGAIKANHPVLLLLKSPLTAQMHWVSIWGFDEKGFYLYDTQSDQQDVPIGNVYWLDEQLQKAVYRVTFLIEVGAGT